MFINETRSQLGFLPLQHERYDRDVGQQFLDQRESIWGVRITGRNIDPGETGLYKVDPDSYGDIIGSFLWPIRQNRRPMPAWRWAWPIIQGGKSKDRSESPGLGAQLLNDTGPFRIGSGPNKSPAGILGSPAPPLGGNRGKGGLQSPTQINAAAAAFFAGVDGQLPPSSTGGGRTGASIPPPPPKNGSGNSTSASKPKVTTSGDGYQPLINSGGRRSPEFSPISEQWHPIRNDDWIPDERFLPLGFKKPSVRVTKLVPVDPGANTSRFENRTKQVGTWPAFPKGWVGIALAADEEIEQNQLLHPTDPRLVAVDFAGDPDAGTIVVDLTDENEVDSDAIARLHTLTRVVRSPITFCGQTQAESGSLALQVHESGQDQLICGLLSGYGSRGGRVLATLASTRGGPIDLGSPGDIHNLGTDGDGTPINQGHIAGGALYRFGPNGAYDAPLKHDGIATFPASEDPEDVEESSNVAPVIFYYDPSDFHVDACGRIKPGKHKWAALIPDGSSIPDIYIAVVDNKADDPPKRVGFPAPGGGPGDGPRRGPGGPGGPLGPPDGPVGIPPGGFPGPNPDPFDGEPPTPPPAPRPPWIPLRVAFPGEFGPEDPFGESRKAGGGFPTDGAPVQGGTKSGSDGGTGEDFVETGRARGVSQLLMRASYHGESAVNFCQWRAPNYAAEQTRRMDYPLVARLEAFGRQLDTLHQFNPTDRPGSSRYRGNPTSPGGIMVLPAETSLLDVDLGKERTDESQTYLALADHVDLGIGVDPHLSSGGVELGWLLREIQGGTQDGHLDLMRGRTGGAWVPASQSVMRLDNVDNAMFDLGQGLVERAGGIGVVGINNAATPPTSFPAAGALVWLESGWIFASDDNSREHRITGDVVDTAIDYTVLRKDKTVVVDASAGTVVITLWDPASFTEREGFDLTVIRSDSNPDTQVRVTVTGGVKAIAAASYISPNFSVAPGSGVTFQQDGDLQWSVR